MTPSNRQSRKPLTLEEVENRLKALGKPIELPPGIVEDMKRILETARAALRVVDEVKSTGLSGHPRVMEALAPFREEEK